MGNQEPVSSEQWTPPETATHFRIFPVFTPPGTGFQNLTWVPLSKGGGQGELHPRLTVRNPHIDQVLRSEAGGPCTGVLKWPLETTKASNAPLITSTSQFCMDAVPLLGT